MSIHPHYASIPVELMDILNRINDNLTDMKQRLSRLEANDYAENIRGLRLEIEKERNERINIQIKLENVKTKLAPIVVGISMLGAAGVQMLIQAIH